MTDVTTNYLTQMAYAFCLEIEQQEPSPEQTECSIAASHLLGLLAKLPGVPKVAPDLAAAAPVMLAALRDAESGLVFAGADKPIPDSRFVPTPSLALRAVRAAIATATSPGVTEPPHAD